MRRHIGKPAYFDSLLEQILNRTNPYETGLDRNPANYVALSPLSFLARTAEVYPQRTALIHGEHCTNWGQTYRRCRRLASALARRGIGAGDTVAIMAPNVPPMFEAHFGVPMTGAVLNTLNTRLDAEALAFMLNHGEARALLTDRELSPTISAALRHVRSDLLVIDIDDPLGGGGDLVGEMSYEAFLETGDPDFAWSLPADEWNAIALSYTSGTTGNPKGVVTHHRGAYLNALGNIVTWAMPHFPVYLWTLPFLRTEFGGGLSASISEVPRSNAKGVTSNWSDAADSGTKRKPLS